MLIGLINKSLAIYGHHAPPALQLKNGGQAKQFGTDLWLPCTWFFLFSFFLIIYFVNKLRNQRTETICH